MKIGVIGSGAWGTALAFIAHRAANEAFIFTRNLDDLREMEDSRENSKYLPGIKIPREINISANLRDVIHLDVLLLSIPAQAIRELCLNLKNIGIAEDTIIVVSSKGIEEKSLKLMSEVVEEILPRNKIAILSGPNYAHQVAKDYPAITSIASNDIEIAEMLARKLANRNFRIYPNSDIIGTQVFGAAKNVLAIATGIVRGSKLGENAEAAIISRGIKEISILNKTLGGKDETLNSPAGFADIYLTCSSQTSRNTSYGISLANGIKDQQKLVEGFFTVKSIHDLAKKHLVSMPICEGVYKIAHQYQSIDKIIDQLLNREMIF